MSMAKPQHSAQQSDFVVRPCRTLDEFAACVALQNEAFGYAEKESYPLRLFVTLGKIGGHVLGGFTAGGHLVGFVGSLPAWRDGRRYYHSLSLAVDRAHQGRGLGRALKLEQRRLAMRAGIELIEWTFDPLRAKNAHLNVVRLGAIARRYLPNHYGHVSSRLQQGLPSDRLMAEWWLRSARVRRAVAGKPPRSSGLKPTAQVPIPADLDGLVETDFAQAQSWQAQVRAQLQELFQRGLAITGVESMEGTAHYLLGRYDD
jgi:predicted GNAT superfamily acetyltransferase